MIYDMPRIVVSALSGGSGKTMASVGLARALTRKGYRVQTFKKGPDYIDTLWASLASGLPPRNLDPYMNGEVSLAELFARACQSNQPRPDLAIIEGNRGLFDGQDARGSCSTAELARQLRAPVVLAVNCTKMTRTTAALVWGCKNFEPDLDVAGVIFNQATRKRHREILKESVELLAEVPVLGAIPRLVKEPFEERYNGLIGEEAVEGGPMAMQRLDALADVIEENVDLEAVVALAKSAPALEIPDGRACSPRPVGPGARPRIGYVRDQAFWFYYTENLEALERAGAELVRVSLLDPAPWPELDGLYIGAGFIEDYAAQLSADLERRQMVAGLIERGLPVYAEGNALYYLARNLKYGLVGYAMCGVFDCFVEVGRIPQGIGYVKAVVEKENPFHAPGTELKGHEFHYARLSPAPGLLDNSLMRMEKGGGLLGGQSELCRDGLLYRNCYASHLQIFAPGAPDWAANFVSAARKFGAGGNRGARVSGA